MILPSDMTAHPSTPEAEGPDIFISYSHRDKRWVDEYLLPQLEAAHLTFVVDDLNFSIGARSLDNMREAVERCQHTLIVLTRDWNRSPWTRYESIIATKKDPTGKSRTVLPVKLKTCDIPSHFSDLSFLDLTRIEDRDREMGKLLKQLGASEADIQAALDAVQEKTLILLIELMSEPKVKSEVSEFRETFEEIKSQGEVVASYKRIHDYLQAVQQALGNVSRDAFAIAEGDDRWREAHSSAGVLRQGLQKLLAYASRISIDRVDISFAVPLRRALGDLADALRERDAARFSYVAEQVSNVISFSLPQVNDRIIQKLRDRPLQPLVTVLQKIYEAVAIFEFDQEAGQLLREFRCGIDTLVEYGQKIRDLVFDHSTLQQMECNLHLTSSSGDPTLGRIASGWNYLKPLVEQLKLEERYQRLLEMCNQLDKRLSDRAAVRDDEFEYDTKVLFDEFISENDCVFNILDVDLDCMFGQLQDHGDKLREIIRKMQNHDNN